jgi:hypothetical protein
MHSLKHWSLQSSSHVADGEGGTLHWALHVPDTIILSLQALLHSLGQPAHGTCSPAVAAEGRRPMLRTSRTQMAAAAATVEARTPAEAMAMTMLVHVSMVVAICKYRQHICMMLLGASRESGSCIYRRHACSGCTHAPHA